MALTTIGSGDTAARVEETIRRRGADGTSFATGWTALAAAGIALAVVAMFATWYQDIRTATAFWSGWTPPIALLMIIGGGLLLVAKQVGLIKSNYRMNADVFTAAMFTGGSLILMARQLFKGGLSDGVYLLVVPLVGLAVSAISSRDEKPKLVYPGVPLSSIAIALLAGVVFIRQLVKGDMTGAIYLMAILLSIAVIITLGRSKISRATLELEQIALGFASIGTGLVVLKRILDSQYATSGWLWGFIAGLAVIVAALAACQYLGILSFFQVVLFAALAISILILVVLIAQVVGDGWPILSQRLDSFWSGTLWSSPDENLGISQGIIGSLWIAVFVVLIAFPIGIASAVYLEEYAPRNALTNALDIVVRNLAGVPSVVYGLLGLFLFVKGNVVTNWFIERINSLWDAWFSTNLIEPGQSTLFAGGVTLAILVLPIVIITSAEAIRAVPQSLREGAFGVGATKWEVIRSQVLPFAAPGILTGTLLALARAIGEAAPLILVGAVTGRLAGRGPMFESVETFFAQFADRFTAMPIVIVGWVANSGRDEGFAPAAGAAIVVLLVFVVLMNSVAVLLRNYFEKKRA